MKFTWPASTNHTDPQLNDTPTRSAGRRPRPPRPNQLNTDASHLPATYSTHIEAYEPFRIGFATTTRKRPVYVAVFVDAIHVKVRDGQVANRPVYAAIGVTVDGHKDVLGLWMGTGGEGASLDE